MFTVLNLSISLSINKPLKCSIASIESTRKALSSDKEIFHRDVLKLILYCGCVRAACVRNNIIWVHCYLLDKLYLVKLMTIF